MKCREIKFILIVLIAIGFTSCTIKEQQMSSARSVSVSGTGSVDIISDEATIILAVRTTNWDVVKAVSENADKMTKVQQALVDSGIAKNDIVTENYSIQQETQYQNGRTVLGQYAVSNDIKIMVRDVTKAGSIIDTAIKAGANNLSSLTFSSKNEEDAVKQARLIAIKKAQETASLLATSSGASLGKVLTIVDGSASNPNVPFLAKSVGFSSNYQTPISAQNTTVTVTVNATYELQ